MKYLINDGVVTIYIQKDIFSKGVILKCLYWYGGLYHMAFEAGGKDCFVVQLAPINAEGNDFNELVAKLQVDLVDFQLREVIAKETHHIRNLLVAKAFAYEEDVEPPALEITDPVGFDPLQIDHE